MTYYIYVKDSGIRPHLHSLIPFGSRCYQVARLYWLLGRRQHNVLLTLFIGEAGLVTFADGWFFEGQRGRKKSFANAASWDAAHLLRSPSRVTLQKINDARWNLEKAKRLRNLRPAKNAEPNLSVYSREMDLGQSGIATFTKGRIITFRNYDRIQERLFGAMGMRLFSADKMKNTLIL